MNYSKLVKQLTAEMKKGVQYKDIPKIFKIFLIIAMIPPSKKLNMGPATTVEILAHTFALLKEKL